MTACQLCKSTENVTNTPLNNSENATDSADINLCAICLEQMTGDKAITPNHWHCLSEAMWSEQPAVQVASWRMLQKLQAEPWAQDLADMLYLDDALLSWAKAGIEEASDEQQAVTRDSNGELLEAGDTVHIIKDLQVKGAGFTAKRGTAVRNISLTNNPEQIEGRVNGQRVVLLSCYLKKA